MLVTYLKGLHKIHEANVDLSVVANEIKTGTHSDTLFDLRVALNTTGKASYNKQKVNLPCFTPSGVFEQAWSRTKEGKRPSPPRKTHLLRYNGVVVLDYDNLDEFQQFELPEKVKECKHTLLCFKSPSNKGYKVLVPTTNTNPDQHATAFKAVEKFYHELTGIASDQSSSNINRLCFLSVDMNLKYNPQATPFEFQAKLFKPKEPVPAKKETTKPPSTATGDVYQRIGKATERVEKQGYHYAEGQRREYIKRLCVECFKYGVEENVCASFVDANLLTPDCNEQMVMKLVADMYNNFLNPSEFDLYNKWTTEQQNQTPTKATKKGDYKPQLYQEKATEVTKIELPKLEDGEVFQIKDTKRKNAILHHRKVEELLQEYFEFRINTLKNQEEYRVRGSETWVELETIEYNEISRSLLHAGVTCTTSKLEKIILSHFSPKVNPLKEMFERWAAQLGDDDDTDYLAQVASLVKTDAPKGLFESIFKKWCVASVANVYVEKQCTNHKCPILIGEQGTNKTTFIASLFPSEYVFVGHVDLTKKDAAIMLSDTFLVVLDEQFSVLNSDKEWEHLKSNISLPRVKERWHYGKRSQVKTRVANFWGTANREGVLQDDTGNRRFYPFKLTAPIDINQFRTFDIRKMWAQAYKLYKSNWYYLPTRPEQIKIDRYQQGFKKLDDEHHLIADQYIPHPTCEIDADGLILMSSTEIWTWLREEYKLNNLSINSIGRAMTFLGFVQKHVTRKGKRGRYWFLATNRLGATQQQT